MQRRHWVFGTGIALAVVAIPTCFHFSYEETAHPVVVLRNGSLNASGLVFTHWRACPESLWWQKNMRGSIEFVASELIVQIEMPRYDDSSSTPAHHVAWEHNGRYRIERSLEPAAPLDPGGCGI